MSVYIYKYASACIWIQKMYLYYHLGFKSVLNLLFECLTLISNQPIIDFLPQTIFEPILGLMNARAPHVQALMFFRGC